MGESGTGSVTRVRARRPVGLRQAPVLPERRAGRWHTQRAGIEFVTPIMQELNWSLFYLQSRIEEIKLLYLIFNGKKNTFPKPFYVSSRLDHSVKKKIDI